MVVTGDFSPSSIIIQGMKYINCFFNDRHTNIDIMKQLPMISSHNSKIVVLTRAHPVNTAPQVQYAEKLMCPSALGSVYLFVILVVSHVARKSYFTSEVRTSNHSPEVFYTNRRMFIATVNVQRYHHSSKKL